MKRNCFLVGVAALRLLDTAGPCECTTPTAAMGDELFDRLRDHAGVRIDVRENA